MSEKPIKIYHFHNGSGGGVLSVIKNLIEFSKNPLVENHIIYTINKDTIPKYVPTQISGSKSAQVFYFSPRWNFWYTCKQLAKLIPDDESIIIAHDWLELGMISHLGLQNPTIQFLHGDFDYYYRLSLKHQDSVDIFIGVSPVIFENLKEKLLQKHQSIFLCYFPVPSVNILEKKRNNRLRIFYCVRNLNEPRKQFSTLPAVNARLKELNFEVEWNIAGIGKVESEIKRLLAPFSVYYGFINNSEVLKVIRDLDVFILPSLEEGLPVSLVEAMKGGLVPLISDWNGATRELVIEGETGFYLKSDDFNGYAKRIISLQQDPEMLKRISVNAKHQAEKLFDPYRNTERVEALFFKSIQRERKKAARVIYGSRLDKKWIPNNLVRLIRGITR